MSGQREASENLSKMWKVSCCLNSLVLFGFVKIQLLKAIVFRLFYVNVQVMSDVRSQIQDLLQTPNDG